MPFHMSTHTSIDQRPCVKRGSGRWPLLPEGAQRLRGSCRPNSRHPTSILLRLQLAACRRLQAMTMIVGRRAHVAGWPVQ